MYNCGYCHGVGDVIDLLDAALFRRRAGRIAVLVRCKSADR